jgi:hypothetical protein
VSFEQRMREAQWHENWVITELRRLEWQAAPFGQALLPRDIREGLRQCETLAGRKAPARWMPDIIALKPPDLRFIDAKAGSTWRRTGNHDIERDALQAALRWSGALTADVWFIFSDGWGATATQVATYRGLHPGSFHGEGSGTAFWLFPRGACRECIRPTPEMPADWQPIAPPLQRVIGISGDQGDGTT